MQPTLRPVRTADDLRRFIRLPLELPDRRPNAVPALLADEQELHDPAKNTQWRNCAVERWIAWQGEVPVGRIMGIVHHGYRAVLPVGGEA